MSKANSSNYVATLQGALDEAAGAGTFAVEEVGGAISITSKISGSALTAKSGNAATATFYGISQTTVAGTAGAALDSTTAANGTATGGRTASPTSTRPPASPAPSRSATRSISSRSTT